MILNQEPADKKKELSYTGKVWLTVAIAALLILVILILRVAFNVLLMVLAGSLIATYFHGLGDLIQQKTGMRRRFAMVISIVGSLVIISALLWFMGNKIQTQLASLSQSFPQTLNTAKQKLSGSTVGQKILESVSGNNSQKLMATAQSFFTTGFGVLGDLYIILFLGIFFTAGPSQYKDGILILVPVKKKALASHIMDRISLSLRGWLKGMLLSIIMITVLLTIGLSIIGLPVALILALITGILELVPNIGSLIAMIPGVLLAFTISGNTAIITAVFYIVSQTIVANIVTPLIQKKIINLPPALTLISQLIMAAISGALGIILAVPLLAIIIILVDELYVKKINGIIVE